MAGAQGNPPWDKAEIILALDLYLNHEPGTKHGSGEEMDKLSENPRSLHLFGEVADPEKFRNRNSVKTKLANLQYLDPGDTAKGMGNAGKLDKEVWDEYHDKPELVRELAKSILESNAEDLAMQILEADEEEQEYPEGKVLYRIHKSRERSSKAVGAAKQAAAARGDLRCSVCGFDFEKTYGKLGKGFIECHHVKPISEYRKGEATRIEDLALVCPNCHRMLHRHKPLLNPAELRELMESAKQ